MIVNFVYEFIHIRQSSLIILKAIQFSFFGAFVSYNATTNTFIHNKYLMSKSSDPDLGRLE